MYISSTILLNSLSDWMNNSDFPMFVFCLQTQSLRILCLWEESNQNGNENQFCKEIIILKTFQFTSILVGVKTEDCNAIKKAISDVS